MRAILARLRIIAIFDVFLKAKGVNMSWEVAKSEGRAGTGNWDAFQMPLEPVFAAAEVWRNKVAGLEKLWLCWNISDRWSIVQQKMILAAGWTPVVGYDKNCKSAKLSVVEGAVFIDFNQGLDFKALWPHFPLEFAFLWAPRLAFWHSDLLVRKSIFMNYAEIFSNIPDGEMAAVFSTGGLRNFFKSKEHRYWELFGCTTASASLHQFENGCGWWRHFYKHPNTPAEEYIGRSEYAYESGVGIAFWEKKYKRKIMRIPEKLLSEGHCSEIGFEGYKKTGDKGVELDLNFDINNELLRLGLTEFS
jgi:hypothetical protein